MSWRKEPIRHKLASYGVRTTSGKKVLKSRGLTDEEQINFIGDMLDDNEYLDVKIVSPIFEDISFRFSFNSRGRKDTSSVILLHSNNMNDRMNGIIRYPKIKDVDEIYKLKEVFENIKEETPCDIDLKYKGPKNEETFSAAHAGDLFKEGKDIYPHIHIYNKNRNTGEEEKYNFSEFIFELSEVIGSEMEEYEKRNDNR